MSLISRALQEMRRAFSGGPQPDPAREAELRGLEAWAPSLAGIGKHLNASRRLLEANHGVYVETVSEAAWALSLETSTFLHAMCSVLRPATILDLGSGFSSVTFRSYARSAGHECVVHSVDSDPAWLERSREYLKSLGLSDAGLMSLDELRSRQGNGYDLVLNDMGDNRLRAETLSFVLSQRAPGGWLLLDDMHKPIYGDMARNACAQTGLSLFPLLELTRDSFGRYACLAGKR